MGHVIGRSLLTGVNRELPHADWEVPPTTPRNYRLDVEQTSPSEDLQFAEHAIGEVLT